ncbi:alpha/beta hydrolase [Sinisalibacter aestuarii]|uniref:Esterase n=1 Tax=Sinisalibacter aestuarii TaxID=2949426 RepID=A0ABQ5LNA1_9RHOB|nr:alpha/beta fold hydrolase [Sinisalibacter aestuarii]GKY86439.1 esterase [Sinisalibacter aestuarii]
MDRRVFLTLTSTLALSACAGRARMVSIDEVNRAGSTVVPILVVSSRNVKEDGSLGSARGEGLAFGRYDVSVPPNRKAGTVNLPRLGANPRKHFATINNEIFPSESTFRSQLKAQLLSRPAGRRNAVVFVHGYNTGYEDGLFRFAQFYTDVGLDDVPVHYSWPSAEKLLRYGYDRDSMLYARDGFEAMLRSVIAAGAERVLIVGHSMGSMLIMESLREIAIGGNAGLRSRIGGVILVSPDIDIDVFRSQVRRIGALPKPFVIFSSKRDRVLEFAANEIYGNDRVGALQLDGELSDLDVNVIDVTEYSKGVLNHSTAITSPAFLKIIGNMQTFTGSFDSGIRAVRDEFPDAIIAVDDADHMQVGAVPF